MAPVAHDPVSGRTYAVINAFGGTELHGSALSEPRTILGATDTGARVSQLIAIDPDGSVAWTARWFVPSGAGLVTATDVVAVGVDGKIYVGGYFNANISIHPAVGSPHSISRFGSPTGVHADAFLMAFETTGALRATTQFRGAGFQHVRAIAPRDIDEVYVALSWSEEVLQVGTTLDTGGLSGGILIAKLGAQSPNLSRVTHAAFETDHAYVQNLRADAAGNVYAAGNLGEGRIIFDQDNAIPSTPEGKFWPFAFSLDSNLDLRWARTWNVGSTEETFAQQTIASDGRVFLAFSATESHPEDFGDFGAPFIEYIYVLGARPEDGSPFMLERIGAVNGWQAWLYAMSIDEEDRLAFVLRSESASEDIGGGDIESNGASDIFLGSYRVGSSFEYEWGRALFGSGYDEPAYLNSVVALNGRRVLVSGSVMGPTELPDEELSLPSASQNVLVEIGFD